MLHLILISLLASCVLGTLAYVLATIIKRADIVDVFWGLYFTAIAGVLEVHAKHSTTLLRILVLLVAIWGIRLAIHIGRRQVGKPEDFRYAKWRKDWGSTFLVRSYLQIFILQAILATVISASLIVAAYNTSASVSTLSFAGLFIWILGYSIELNADSQLAMFLKHRTKPGSIMTGGLWKYSRHPNYFGEITQWWGIWIMVASLSYGLFAIISPVTITTLILFVSGIPMLEKHYKDNKAYQEYAKKTSILIPLPQKKSSK